MTLVNGSELARWLGVSRQLISRAVKQGRIGRRKDGRFDLDRARAEFRASIIQPHVNGVAGGGPAGGKVPSLVESKTAEAAYRARLARIQLEEREGRLLDAGEVRNAVSCMITTARSRLLAIPDELGDKFASLSDPLECTALLSEKILEALVGLADYPAVQS